MLKAEKSTLLYTALVLFSNASDVALNPGPQAEISHMSRTASLCARHVIPGIMQIVKEWVTQPMKILATLVLSGCV